jgi:hypothetical protein
MYVGLGVGAQGARAVAIDGFGAVCHIIETGDTFMPFCPKCCYEYFDGTPRCPDCDVELVDKLPPEPVYSDEEKVTVFVARDEMEAKIVKGVIEDAGIPVWEKSDIVKAVDPLTVGPLSQEGLAVPVSRADEARKAIEKALSEGGHVT